MGHARLNLRKIAMTSTSPAYTVSDLHTDASSGLRYRVRLPVPAQIARCVVLLHGVGSNEIHMADVATGVDAQTLVIFAQGPLQLGPQQFAWFRVAFTASGPSIVPEEAQSSRKALIAFVQSLQTQYSVQPEQTVIAGFSQGGIMSASVGLSAPQQVSGFAILSGRILPELAPYIADKDALQKLRVLVAHGEHDSKLPVMWAQRSDQWLTELGVQHTVKLYPIDHTISAAMHTDFLAWLSAA